MSAAGPCNYTFLKIVKPTGHGEKNAGVEVGTKGKILGLDYYESVYSPMVTANMVQFDTGNSVVDSRTGLRGTLKDALPLEGMEQVFFNVATKILLLLLLLLLLVLLDVSIFFFLINV